MADIHEFGHYYKECKFFGMKKITIVDIDANGLATFVYGHRSPTETELLNKMQCMVSSVLEDIPEEQKKELEAKEIAKYKEKVARRRKESAEKEERDELNREFIKKMKEHGIEITEAFASWMTPEQMDKALVDVLQEIPEEGFNLM